jgi:hypothetical protein
VAADDPMAAQEVVLAAEQVHRAALAARDAIGAAEQLGHDGAGGYAAGDRLGVVAVGGDDVVIVAERGNRARAGRLLADVQMAEAADLAEGVGFGASLLESALQEHGAEQTEVEPGIGRGRLGAFARDGGWRRHTPADWTCSQA